MFTIVPPLMESEVAYRRERLTRDWGHAHSAPRQTVTSAPVEAYCAPTSIPQEHRPALTQ